MKEARKRNGKLVITLPLINPPRKSKSGKSYLLATSRGPRRTSIKHNRMPIYFIANAYVRAAEFVKSNRLAQAEKVAMRRRAKRKRQAKTASRSAQGG